jgi:hypothetical protein
VDPTQSGRETEILDVSSSGRYQFWETAADAYATEPVVGIGPGTFEFWWARSGSLDVFVRDAHSLYMETLGELGIVGLLLIGAFTGAVLALGAIRAIRSSSELRLGLAAATAGCSVLIAGASVDWLWELGALQVAFLALAAVAVAGGDVEPHGPSSGPERRSWMARHLPAAAVIAVSVAAIVAIAIPLAGRSAVDASRSDAGNGQLEHALAQARVAERLQPYAATPLIQQALVLEQAGDLDGAVEAATDATAREATNWRVWLILSRLEAKNEDPDASLDAYRTARSLNPLLP